MESKNSKQSKKEYSFNHWQELVALSRQEEPPEIDVSVKVKDLLLAQEVRIKTKEDPFFFRKKYLLISFPLLYLVTMILLLPWVTFETISISNPILNFIESGDWGLFL